LHFNEYALAEPNITLKDAYAFNPRSRNSRWKPGTFATYSNANPQLAAYVLEKVTGRTFEDFVQNELFDPLGMDTASYFLTPEVEQLIATGYEGSKKHPKPVDYWHIIMRPSGSINASAREMAHLVRMFLNRGVHQGKRILSAESIDHMETPTTTLAAQNGLYDGYGLNNYTKTFNGFVWHGHNGGMMGFVADLIYQPELGVGFVVMINKSSGALGKLNKRISDYLMHGIEKPDLPADIPLDRAVAEKYSGYYRPATSRNQFTFGLERLPFQMITAGDGHFKVRGIPGGSYELTPVEGGLYRAGKKWMATAVFMEDKEGKRYFQNGAFGTLVKVSAFSAWGQFFLAVLCVVLMLSSLILFPVYGIGRLIGKCKDVQDWGVRLIPPMAVIFLILSFAISAFIVTSNQRLFDHFGNMTILSLSLYLFDWIFVALTLTGLYKAIQACRNHISVHGFAKIYILCVSLGSTIYVGYTLYWNPWVPMWLY